MKKTLITLFILVTVANIALIGYYFGQKNILKKVEEALDKTKPRAVGKLSATNLTIDGLLDAIEWVESKGQAGMMGDAEPVVLERKVGATVEINYRAIGAYQIHKIYVDDVNRILSGPNPWSSDKRYTYADRWNKAKSREMTWLYLDYYSKQLINNDPYHLRFCNAITWFEMMARIHNGGPDGFNKDSTKPYWTKVKARLDTN